MFAISLFKYIIDKIIIYPFGGLTKYNALLNSSIYKEIIILLFGPLFQIIFYFIILILYKKGFVNINVFNIFYNININLLFFNLLPILPLDGGKLMNLIFDIILPYKISHIISIIISIIILIIFITINFSIFYLLLAVILVKSIINEILNHKIKFDKFLIERYIYKLNLKEGNIINKISEVKRGIKHKIKVKEKIYNEKEYLNILFD